MKPKESWPLILYAADLEEYLNVSRSDAAAILRTAEVIDPSKERGRAVTKRALIAYLEGEQR